MRARAIEKRAFGTRDRRLSSNLYLVMLILYLYQLSTVKFYDILSEAYNRGFLLQIRVQNRVENRVTHPIFRPIFHPILLTPPEFGWNHPILKSKIGWCGQNRVGLNPEITV